MRFSSTEEKALAKLLLEFFSELSRAAAHHQAAIEPKATRDALQVTCGHQDWDVLRQCCKGCGVTRWELIVRNERWN